MKAVWEGKIIAEAPKEDLIYIEENWYFPPDSLKKDFFQESKTPYHCPWKGDCTYYNVCEGEKCSRDTAWTYKDPFQSAIEKVKKDFSNYVAFWRDVKVTE